MSVWQENITPGRFADQKVIVTGAASGIGLATALRVAREGGRVIASNLSGEGLDSFQPVHELDDETWQRVLDVNLNSMMRLMRAVVPLMLDAGYGSIVNVTLEAGRRGAAAGAAYTVSGGTRTNIPAEFKSQLATGVPGPLLQANVPPIADAEEVAAGITLERPRRYK